MHTGPRALGWSLQTRGSHDNRGLDGEPRLHRLGVRVHSAPRRVHWSSKRLEVTMFKAQSVRASIGTSAGTSSRSGGTSALAVHRAGACPNVSRARASVWLALMSWATSGCCRLVSGSGSGSA